LPKLTPAAIDSLVGTPGYGVNAAAVDVADNAGLDTSVVGSGASKSFNPLPISTNEMVASGMGPGSAGAAGAVVDALTPEELAAASGVVTEGATPALVQAAAQGAQNYIDSGGSQLSGHGGGPGGTDIFLEQSVNQGVASGLSPGSMGAEMAANGDLTLAQLAAAAGTTLTNTTSLPRITTSLPRITTPARTATTSTTTTAPASTGGLPTYQDPSIIEGKLLKLGKVGSSVMPIQLRQLYDTLTAQPAQGYTYANDDPLAEVDMSKYLQNTSPFQQSQPAYAQGGLVQHLAAGAQPVPDYNRDDVMAALKSLGAIGFEPAKVARPQLMAVPNMAPSNYSPKVLPQLTALLKARGMKFADGGQPDDQAHPNYDGTPVFRTGGLSGLGGKYVEGKGDGTSDDITAMLANGEYVFSADVVSALGNGSNKAGAEKLNEMVHSIRARARSAPPDKLPLDAKSPLEYLKSSKGAKHG